MKKTGTCARCGRKLGLEPKRDKDGLPVCDGCWEVEEEQLQREEVRRK